MNVIESQIRRARRRLVMANFARTACRALAVTWAVAAIAIIVRACVVVPVDVALWDSAWILGATATGLLVALGWSIVTAPAGSEVATEIDTRFKLQERLGSVFALPAEVRETAIGRALVADATRSAEPIDIRDRFPLAPSRSGWLPLIPAALMAATIFLPVAGQTSRESEVSAELVSQTAQVTAATEVLKRKIRQQKTEAEAAGLKDAEELFTKVEAELNKLDQRSAVGPKEAMIALNDIKKQLDKRREELGSPDQLRQTLARLQDADSGPAGELVKSFQNGEFGNAQKQVDQLTKKLRDGDLTQPQREELQRQIETLSDGLSKAGEKHDQAKTQLREQIDQARRDGRDADANQLQQQLDRLTSQDQSMKQLQSMADALGQAAESLQNGQTADAAEALEAMANQLQQMQAAQEQLEDLQDTLDSLAQSKQQLRCESCSAQGCSHCQGGGASGGESGGDSRGESRGNSNSGRGNGGDQYGSGKGPGGQHEEQTDTSSYDSQVRGEPKTGRGVIAGVADGPNRKGVSRESIKEAVSGAVSDRSDPLENQTLPRVERDHTREYFDRLRQGTPAKSSP